MSNYRRLQILGFYLLLLQHFDYIHRNPVKHKLVDRVVDWPYSTFHKYVKAGIYPANWYGDNSVKIEAGE